jgi:membrane-associated phospholipid phosphatase
LAAPFRIPIAVSVVLAVAAAAPVARAQAAPPAAPPVAAPPVVAPPVSAPPVSASSVPAPAIPALRYSLTTDLAVTGGSVAFWIGTEALKSHLAPSTCRWCDPPGFDSSVRDALRWHDIETANVISYIVPLGVEPLVLFGMDALAASRDQAAPGTAWVDILLISEATSVAMAMNQVVKFAVGRERPFIHALPEDGKAHVAHPSDNNVSFYSGHATFAFAMAVSAGTIASMRRYRMAPCFWATGLLLAAATAYLRIAADRHYFSDVTVGAVIGSATGALLPRFFHGQRRVTVAPAPLENGGAVLAIRGTF